MKEYELCIKHFGAPALGSNGKYNLNEASMSMLYRCPGVSHQTINAILVNKPFPDWSTMSYVCNAGGAQTASLMRMFTIEKDPTLTYIVTESYDPNMRSLRTERIVDNVKYVSKEPRQIAVTRLMF